MLLRPTSFLTGKRLESDLQAREWTGKDFGYQTVEGIELLSMEALPAGYPCFAKLLTHGPNTAGFEVLHTAMYAKSFRYNKMNLWQRSTRQRSNDLPNF
jgi:hypothetical protein